MTENSFYSSLIPKWKTARFCLIFVLNTIYMLAGAAIFSFLERPTELEAQKLWKRRLRNYSHEHNISYEDLKPLLEHYEEARTAGIRTEQRRAQWDFLGAVHFVITAVSTIGFGATAPATMTGKILLVFYGLLGCSATLLFFNLFLERVVTSVSLLLFWCKRRRTGHSGIEDGNREDNTNEDWKPSAHLVTLIVLVVVALYTCVAAYIYTTMEDWTFSESLYFCFVTFSTVGFGDFVSGQNPEHTWWYHIVNCIMMFMGVCWTYSLFNIITIIIRQGLNWMLTALNRMSSSICHSRVQFRPHSTHGCCDSALPICCSENDTPGGFGMGLSVCSRGSEESLPRQ